MCQSFCTLRAEPFDLYSYGHEIWCRDVAGISGGGLTVKVIGQRSRSPVVNFWQSYSLVTDFDMSNPHYALVS